MQAINKREVMKRRRTYKPKGLSKQEKKYLDAMFRRQLIMTLLVMLMGAVILAGIFISLKEVVAL